MHPYEQFATSARTHVVPKVGSRAVDGQAGCDRSTQLRIRTPDHAVHFLFVAFVFPCCFARPPLEFVFFSKGVAGSVAHGRLSDEFC